MSALPEPNPQPTDPQAGQPTPIDTTAAQLLNSVNEALAQAQANIAADQTPLDIPTSYRNPQPLPTIGPTPPVPQPGRPAMSSKATDDSVRMLSFGAMTLLSGGGAAVVMLASNVADPTVIGIVCAAPVGLALPILAIGRLLRSAKEAAEAAPPENHHHYNGPVYQDARTTNTTTKGLIANTRNQLPH
ncbi:hypothetical protein [Streptomyces sp. Da 82-17]|uniref:hypothetical protein n=1 Tax=Streptomyces sp. Da 82-17 TaxID=3377116 RepID=UPI0038D3715E